MRQAAEARKIQSLHIGYFTKWDEKAVFGFQIIN
jgi:hypothetical protein